MKTGWWQQKPIVQKTKTIFYGHKYNLHGIKTTISNRSFSMYII